MSGAGATEGPLAGLKMLDLTHMLSGPYGAMILTDLGVETVKIEPPGRGEGTRRLLSEDPRYSVDGMGPYFMTLNRGKKSVCLDLKSADGLALFHDLAEKVDIVFDNFSPGVTARIGIDHDALAARNPRIVTCSVTGFGETGPHAGRPAFDMVAQAMGGGMSITGAPDGGPTRSGIPIGDLGGGVFGVIGVLAALHERARTGRGRHVDISMLDVQISLLNYMATMHFLSGENPRSEGNGHFVHVPYNAFRTQTRHLIVAVIGDTFWPAVVETLGLPERFRAPELERQPGRFAVKAEIEAAVQEALLRDSCEAWLEKLSAARVPCAPVNDFAHALNDPQVAARGMVIETPLPNGRRVKMPGDPVKLSGAGPAAAPTPPPLLGADTDAVLGDWLELSEERLRALRASGAIA